MIGYAPGDALPARQPEKQYSPDFGEYFGNPLRCPAWMIMHTAPYPSTESKARSSAYQA